MRPGGVLLVAIFAAASVAGFSVGWQTPPPLGHACITTLHQDAWLFGGLYTDFNQDVWVFSSTQRLWSKLTTNTDGLQASCLFCLFEE